MVTLEEFVVAVISAIAQAIAAQAVPAIVAALQKPSTAQESAPPAGEQQAVINAVQAAIKSGEAP